MASSPIDRIGDRLDRPDLVPDELKHLIADDVARVEKILSIPVSGRVLDVGCSDGAITRRIMAQWEVEAVGADIRHQAMTPCGFQPWQWDVREPVLRFKGASMIGEFDAVYACEVFEHLTDADAQLALTNILAVLKRGGDLIVTVPNRYPHDLYEVGCRSRWAWPDHRSIWTPPKLQMWLTEYFRRARFIPLYPEERYEESIWLIVHASGKK